MRGRRLDPAIPAGAGSVRAALPAGLSAAEAGPIRRGPPGPLPGRTAFGAGRPDPAAQAMALRQAAGGRPERAGPVLLQLQLQRERGNRYVHDLVSRAWQAAPGPAVHSGPPAGPDLPEAVRSGVEAISGISLGPVRVQYDSPEPARLNAAAFARRGEVHLAPGQERYLAHEAWHLVQQAQGRVRPTARRTGAVRTNEDAGLEAEADAMGARVLLPGSRPGPRAGGSGLPLRPPPARSLPVVQLGGGGGGGINNDNNKKPEKKKKKGKRKASKTNSGGKGDFIGPEGGIHVHIYASPKIGSTGHLKIEGAKYRFKDPEALAPHDQALDGIVVLQKTALNTEDDQIKRAYREIRARFPHWFGANQPEPEWYKNEKMQAEAARKPRRQLDDEDQ